LKSTWFKSGLWNAICDRCGFKFKNTDLKQTWDGLMVCASCWEPRHPQELIRPIPDQNKLPWTRPEGSLDLQVGNVTIADGSTTISSSDVGTLVDGTSSATIILTVPLGVIATVTFDSSIPSGTTIKVYNSGTLTYDDNSIDTTLIISNFTGGTSVSI